MFDTSTTPENLKAWKEYGITLLVRHHEGVRAIMFLQSLPGIREDALTALGGWRGMNPRQQQWTLDLYRRLNS